MNSNNNNNKKGRIMKELDTTKIVALRHSGPPQCWCEECLEVYTYFAHLLEGHLTPLARWELKCWQSSPVTTRKEGS